MCCSPKMVNVANSNVGMMVASRVARSRSIRWSSSWMKG
jgi:hypothetical protein